MNYDEAKALHARARSKDTGRKVANNTRVVQRGEAYAVRLHETDILTFDPDGSVVYNTGGWRTVTTKERMNRYGPARVWSDRGVWYITTRGRDTPQHLYAEGVRVLAGGTIEGAAPEAERTRERKLRREIAAFAENYTKALTSGAIAEPGPGDCWFCVMRTEDGEPLGEATRDASHIEGHIRERYYVPALAWNALEAARAGDAYKQYVYMCQHGQPRAAWGGPGSFIEKRVKAMIRKYVTRQMGMAA